MTEKVILGTGMCALVLQYPEMNLTGFLTENNHIGSVRVIASGSGSANTCETAKQLCTLSKVPALMAELPHWSPVRSNGSQ